ncbi:hypothetical protein DFQ28_009995 [Apophysomyces sp. BC1034]|nr:hypothetical protein DFQ30_005879 [Apophysomyces sp. BC1015]KAG0174645.1 hypothetical protein DFQ29_007416 [Apophysomyces sp. BC1021]KAG0185063.1 hypothetical protein DFQ28_009995 [Apophysomyces sp. BC1034]
MAAITQRIKIDIISDTVCPWCFIGKRRLDRAMEQIKTTNPNAEFQIEWHPYQLDPALSKEPITKLEMYRRRFGEVRARQMVPAMKKLGLEEGIRFAYDGVIANTLDSHRLVYWAKQFGKQNEMVEEMFTFYFEQDKCLTDYEALAEAAAHVGLDKTKALEYLKSDKDVDAVRTAVFESQRNSVHGVPNFTIQNKYNLSGAQDPETLVEVFEEILKDSK